MNDPEKEYQLIFERLRDTCQKRKVTNYSLAKLTNLSNSSISNLMRGKTKPYLYTMLLICAALDIPMIELFGDKGKENTEKQHIIQAYRMMPQEKKRMVRIYIDMLMEYNGNL